MQLNRIKSKHRLLISGTPVQNDLRELLSLLSFLMPHVFAQIDCEILLEAFGYKKSDKTSRNPVLSLNKMRRVLAPFIMRRLKKDVLNQLVDKDIKTIMVGMSDFQKKVYFGIMQSYALRKSKMKEAAEREADFDGISLENILNEQLGRGGGIKNELANISSCEGSKEEASIIDLSRDDLDVVLKRELTATEANHLFTALRKAANHVLLLRIRFAKEDVMHRIAQVALQVDHFGSQCDMKMVRAELNSMSDFDLNQICQEYSMFLGGFVLDASCLYDSPKMEWLRDNVPLLIAQGHRILIFSQWTRLLDLLEVLMEDLDLLYLRLDGSTPVVDRQHLINRFR